VFSYLKCTHVASEIFSIRSPSGMAVISLEPRGSGDGGGALVNILVARTGTPPRPGSSGLPSNGTNSTATTFSRFSNHSPGMDVVAAIVGMAFVVIIAGGLR
jgi:hypothetical protein